MDTSFLATGPISWPALVAFALFLFGLGRVVDWISSKFRAGTDKAVSPLTVDMAAVKIQIASQADQLNAFKVEVARTYVTGDAISRLEKRIDDTMREMREAVLKAIVEGNRMTR